MASIGRIKSDEDGFARQRSQGKRYIKRGHGRRRDSNRCGRQHDIIACNGSKFVSEGRRYFQQLLYVQKNVLHWIACCKDGHPMLPEITGLVRVFRDTSVLFSAEERDTP
jgi:hypothetical protein